MGHLRKGARSEQSWPKTGTMEVTTTSSVIVAGSLKHFGVYILLMLAPDTDLMFVLLDFVLALVPFPFYLPVFTFWNGNVYLVLLYVRRVQLSFHLQGFTAKSFP